MTGYIHSIETGGTVDGPGIRYVVFLQGCPLRCQFCHNPDSWKPKTGRVSTPEELIRDVERYRPFIKHGGLTVSGGEPLFQADFVRELLTLCRARDIHSAIDTSGAIPLGKAIPALELADLILLDIKSINPAKAKILTGQSNASALETLDWCESRKKPVWIRHVVVPGHTDSWEDLRALGEKLRAYDCVQKVELLAFHQMGTYKWEALGRRYPLKDCPTPGKAFMAEVNELFLGMGLPMGR